MPGADLRHAWTPSFSLMGHESLIMQQSDIGAISESIKDRLRCGKLCPSTTPRANLLYSPRNKILATSRWSRPSCTKSRPVAASAEALGRARTWPTTTRCKLHALSGGHRLRRRVHEHARCAAWAASQFNPGTASAMFFLNAKDPATINATRKAMVGVGKIQRAAHDLLSAWRASRPRSRPPRWASRRCVSRSSTSSTRRCRAACPSRPRASCWTSRTPTTFRSSAIRRRPRPTPRRCSTPRPVPSACSRRPGDPGDAGHAGVQTVPPPG